MIRGLGRLLLGLALVLALAAAALKWRYGGGAPFPDRSTQPLLPATAVEVVAELPWPPGNLAVDTPERIFFSFHPEGRPPVSLAVWENDSWHAWPGSEWQPGGGHASALREVLSVRLNRERRLLWALDTGFHGLHPGRLLAFDADTGELHTEHVFERHIAGLGSHLNDFQISPDGNTIYIAEASFFAQTPALVVYDRPSNSARRVLDGHPSVMPERYLPEVGGRRMEALGLVAIRPGVDSIALSADGEWLYFAPVTDNYLWKLRTRDLRDSTLSPEALAKKVERHALKSMSDGILALDDGRILLTDPEHFAIHQLQGESLRTLVQHPNLLRWPDGLSSDTEGRVYITASGLHQIIGRPPSAVRKGAPWHLLRFAPPS